MIAAIFEGSLILLVFVLMLSLHRMNRTNDKLRQQVWQVQAENASLAYRNEVLLGRAGVDMICWAKEDNENLDVIKSIPPERTVIISATDLYNIYSTRYTQGVREANPNAPVAQHFVRCTDNKFDGMYRDHVNELRDIAIQFHGAGQLRARISDKVLGFRDNLNAVQHGLKLEFPNGPSGRPQQKLPAVPQVRSSPEKF